MSEKEKDQAEVYLTPSNLTSWFLHTLQNDIDFRQRVGKEMLLMLHTEDIEFKNPFYSKQVLEGMSQDFIDLAKTNVDELQELMDYPELPQPAEQATFIDREQYQNPTIDPEL